MPSSSSSPGPRRLRRIRKPARTHACFSLRQWHGALDEAADLDLARLVVETERLLHRQTQGGAQLGAGRRPLDLSVHLLRLDRHLHQPTEHGVVHLRGHQPDHHERTVRGESVLVILRHGGSILARHRSVHILRQAGRVVHESRVGRGEDAESAGHVPVDHVDEELVNGEEVSELHEGVLVLLRHCASVLALDLHERRAGLGIHALAHL
mmetsp:Transcript_34518/g.79945  ORF Transcript_34518/g.79945 Transcript_34518/m.79945 type:complete len:209 (+) Transcript_34518:440-1066(+)